jgi:hypothetical protein
MVANVLGLIEGRVNTMPAGKAESISDVHGERLCIMLYNAHILVNHDKISNSIMFILPDILNDSGQVFFGNSRITNYQKVYNFVQANVNFDHSIANTDRKLQIAIENIGSNTSIILTLPSDNFERYGTNLSEEMKLFINFIFLEFMPFLRSINVQQFN